MTKPISRTLLRWDSHLFLQRRNGIGQEVEYVTSVGNVEGVILEGQSIGIGSLKMNV